MSILIGSARSDEHGHYHGGTPGDQKQTTVPDYTGEVSMQSFYVHTKGWRVLRPRDTDNANNIATYMQIACNNAHIGYDQDTRYGVITYGITTTQDINCDCSSLVRECIIEATGTDPGDFTTENESTILYNSGLFEPPFDYTSAVALKTGDILVTKTSGHTAIVLQTEASSWIYKVAVGSASYLTEAEMQNNALIIYDYFSYQGATVEAVAGLLGNLEQESTINPGCKQTSSTSSGWGLIQWTPSTVLTNWCNKYGYTWYDGDAQLERIQCEGTGEKGASGYWLPTSAYPYSWDEFLALTDVEEATKAYLYERERAGTAELENRIAYANKWYEYLSGQPVPPVPPVPPTPSVSRRRMPVWMMTKYWK